MRNYQGALISSFIWGVAAMVMVLYGIKTGFIILAVFVVGILIGDIIFKL